MMPHQATDLLTKITNCAPGDEGRQLWEDALQLFFCGDQDLIDYVQMTVGMAAVGKVYVEALIIAYGEGRNGKSTFWNTISRVLGTYSGAMSADSLTANCRRNVKPEIAELKGKRLIIAAELEEGTRLSTSILKQLCSTDQIRGEKKFKDPFDFTPSHTAVLYTNHLPKVSASDDGTWRRLIVIPFHAKIEGSSDIKNYADYLFNNAGPAVMSWIIEGARKVIEREFKIEPPKVVANAIAEYRGMNDWLSHFLEDCCVTGVGLEQKPGIFIRSTGHIACVPVSMHVITPTSLLRLRSVVLCVRRKSPVCGCRDCSSKTRTLRINVNWCRTETEFISVFILHFGKKVQGMQDVYINTRTGKILKNFL